MKVADLLWLAGLWEGEGCFSKLKSGWPLMRLAMTDEDIVDRASQILSAKTHRATRLTKGGKAVFWCSIQGTRAVGWMMTLYGLMGKRRRHRISELLDEWKSVVSNRGNRYACQRGHPRIPANAYYHAGIRWRCKPCVLRSTA